MDRPARLLTDRHGNREIFLLGLLVAIAISAPVLLKLSVATLPQQTPEIIYEAPFVPNVAIRQGSRNLSEAKSIFHPNRTAWQTASPSMTIVRPPKLEGIIGVGGRFSAGMRLPNKDELLWARKSQNAGDWEVKEITASSVELIRDGQILVLRLD